MPVSGLSTFALVALGLLIGLLLSALVVSIAAITYTLILQRRDARQLAARMVKVLDSNTTAVHLLRTEVVTSLARMDADRMHDASVGVQRAEKRLNETVTALWKLVFKATTSAPGEFEYDVPLPPTLDDEAIADADRIARGAQLVEEPTINPLDHLSEADRTAAIHAFFSAKRQRTDSGGYATTMEMLSKQAAEIAERFGTPTSSSLPDSHPDDELIDSLDSDG